MHLSRTTKPSLAVVSTADMKTHMRVTHSDEDAYIDTLVAAATYWAENYTGRAFLTQTWTLNLRCFPSGDIPLPRPPLASVTSLKYRRDATTTTTLVLDTDYEIHTGTGSDFACVAPYYGTTWPTPIDTPNAVQVVYVCGWTAAANVPADIVHAVKMVAAELYERREQTISGTIITDVRMAAQRLLQPHVVQHWGYPLD